MLKAFEKARGRLFRHWIEAAAAPPHNPHAVPLDCETQRRQTMHVQFALRIQHYERERYGRPVSAVYHFPADRGGVRP